MEFLRILLIPFALIYGLMVVLRNKLFDWGVFRSKEFDIPIISVGNLSTGGSGKSPQIEYLIRILRPHYKVATLSRGYGRHSKGFRIVSPNHTPVETGDEPLQYARKFEDVIVAVDEKRVNGIRQLRKKFPEIEVILLDDAFQHRWVKPGLSMLLTDYHSLYTDDFILPTGNLREPKSGAKRADMIIITKTANVFSPLAKRLVEDKIKPRPYQSVYYSYIEYNNFKPLWSELDESLPKQANTILLFTGIANSYPLVDYLKRFCDELITLEYSDHHHYSISDLKQIKNTYDNIVGSKKVIVTTEKDAMRLSYPKIKTFAQQMPIFYMPIEVKIHFDNRKEDFEKQVLDYVRNDKRNRNTSETRSSVGT
ncbi:MAG: tetraacyldisaccharide 4'-kinase [Bacteroidales bacterium]|nr:tetraacyldisaccharide 4'-kinase [Bacteroidales bacterium]